MRTILTVTTAGTPTDYDGEARAAAGLVLTELDVTLEGYDRFTFAEFACGPIPKFIEGSPFSVSLADDLAIPPPPPDPDPGYFAPSFFAPTFFPSGYFGGVGGGGGGGGGGGTTSGYFTTGFFAPTFFAPDYFGFDGLDVTAPRVVISGRIAAIEAVQDATGWVYLYRCDGLKRMGDYVPVQAQDGTGDADYNLQPDDPDYDQSRAGQSVGGIVQQLLEVEATARALHALGIGGYLESSPGVISIPASLNATTITDLTFLTIVPPSPVHLRGEGLFRSIEQLVLNWHPQFATWVRPADGIIRFQDLFGLPTYTLTVPGNGDPADPVDWPRYTPSIDQCYTQVKVVGVDVQPAYLKTSEKTLVPAWTAAEQAVWTIDQFLTPSDSSDEGAILSCTANSCVVRSDHPSVFWILNFWNGRQGQISLLDTAATGIDMFQFRDITSCTAMSPGGTATITWDASLPITATSYDRYTMLCTSAPLSRVWREYWVADPSTCTTSDGFTTCDNVGTATWVGSHFEHRFPNGVNWANNGKIIRIYSPSGVVVWSQSGAFPYIAFPLNIKIEAAQGKIIFNQPVVVPFSDPGLLKRGSPSGPAQGLPVDVQVAVPYNLGDMVVQAPLAGTGVDGGDYSGTAKSRAGIERVLTLYRPEWNYRGNTAAYQTMAEQHLATVQDISVEGSIGYHLDAGPHAFDMLTMGYALNIAIAGSTGRLDSVYLPVRSISLRWPDAGPDLHYLTMSFSNRRRPFEGDDLYVHPQWGGDTFGTQQGQTFVGGRVGEVSGEVDAGMAAHGSMLSGQQQAKVADANQADFSGKQITQQSFNDPLGKAIHSAGGNQGGDWTDALGKSGKHYGDPPRPKSDSPDSANQEPPAGTPINPDGPAPKKMTLREQRYGDATNQDGG